MGETETPVGMYDEEFAKFCQELELLSPSSADFCCQAGDSCLTFEAQQRAHEAVHERVSSRKRAADPGKGPSAHH